MKALIKPQDMSSEFYTEERCHIIEVSNDGDDPAVSIARARIEPGVTTAWHRLKDTVERYSIVSGTGAVEVGDLPKQTVTAGDVVIIPAMVRQRIGNIGEDDLILLAICSPRFEVENYESLE
jgi:mannose-6-phosphate isomerase-like protein (cupin superfamily)